MTEIPKVCIIQSPMGEAVVETRKKWEDNKVLKVCFLNGDDFLRREVRKRFERYHDLVNLKFEFTDDPDAEIRVAFKFDGDTASWSYIGTDCLSIPNNKPTMNFGWFDSNTSQEEFDRTGLHEIAHCIGFKHEQGHPLADINWNKPAVIEYYQKRGWKLEAIERNVFSKHDPLTTEFTEYDPKSIMHYPIPVELVNDPNDAVGWNTDFSKLDIEFLKKQYPISA